MIKNNLSKEELQQIVILDKEAHKEIKWWNLAKKSNLVKTNSIGLLFLIIYKKKNIGFIRYIFRKHYEDYPVEKSTIFLEDLFISKKFRLKNLASESIFKSINLLRNKYKLSKVKLEAPLRLKDFYEKQGFEPNHIVMTKKL